MYWDEVILVAGVGLFCTTGNTGTPHQIQIQIQYKYHCTHVFRNINTNEMQDKNKYNNRQKSMVFYTEFPTVDMRSHWRRTKRKRSSCTADPSPNLKILTTKNHRVLKDRAHSHLWKRWGHIGGWLFLRSYWILQRRNYINGILWQLWHILHEKNDTEWMWNALNFSVFSVFSFHCSVCAMFSMCNVQSVQC